MPALSDHYPDKMEGYNSNSNLNQAFAGDAPVTPAVEPLPAVVARLAANIARAVTHGVQAVQENNTQLLEIRQTLAATLPQTAGGWSSGSSGAVIPGKRGRRPKKGKKAVYINSLHASDFHRTHISTDIVFRKLSVSMLLLLLEKAQIRQYTNGWFQQLEKSPNSRLAMEDPHLFPSELTGTSPSPLRQHGR